MIKEIKLPEISENVESGVVVEVLVKVGDFVEQEQPLVSLETEKATFEVPSTAAGKIVEVNVKEDDEVKVGQVIVKVDTQASASEQQEEEKPSKEVKQEEKKEQEAPREKKEVPVEKKEKPAAKEEIPTPAEHEKEQPETEQVESREEKIERPLEVPAAPSVRQLARELGVDISRVTGGGPGGRISAEDIKEYAKSIITGAKPGGPDRKIQPLPDFSKWGKVERQSMSVTRRKIAETLSYAWSNIPHVAQYDHADITALEQFRAECGEEVKKAGGKLTVTSIMLKIVAEALKVFPKFNAGVDSERNEIIFKKYYHVNVAVDTERGLLVPVIRDVDKKSIVQLSVELTELAEKTRNNKLTPEEMVGGNFTISNLGGLGGTGFAPIIYWPQVAILGIARAAEKPVYVEGELKRRLILPLSLSYDHRIIDGAEGVRFLRWIVDALEKPFLLAMRDGVK